MAKLARPKPGMAPTVAVVVLGALLLLSAVKFQTSVSANTTSRAPLSPSRRPRVLTTDSTTPADVDTSQLCQLVLGDWCHKWHTQTPIAWQPPPRGDKPCLWGCNFVGVCDAIKGICRCPAGWQGDACDVPMRRPCSQRYRDHGFEPFNEPVDVKKNGIVTKCVGACDEDIGMCFCPSNTTYGRIPAEPHLPPGTPPISRGRPLGHLCQPNKTPDGAKTDFGSQDPADLADWCNNPEPKLRCPCFVDNQGGEYCDLPQEAFCVNQCNGHGECHIGFCKCHEGWFGQDCAYRLANVSWTPGLETERPWIADQVHTPASWDPEPGAVRKRPLIYVYELPAKFNAHLLQYRVDRIGCAHRWFQLNGANGANATSLSTGGYNLETGFHELVLQSEHRTLNAEEADFYYMPVYVSCYIYPIHAAGDFPFFHGGPGTTRSQAATNMLVELYHWVRSHHPYWDRRHGKDHLLVITHDEGSCYVPAVLRNSTVLANWGYAGLNNESFTSYWDDVFTREWRHPVWQPEGHLSKIGHYVCHDPSKDLVVPVMKPPFLLGQSPFLGARPRNRSILASHKGRLLTDLPRYSRGTRQKLAQLAVEQKWWQKHKIYIGEQALEVDGVLLSYSEILSSSIFCLVLMGEGYTTRFDESLASGCIPIIIMDDVYVSFETILDIKQFSMRIPVADMHNLPELLHAVPQETILQMQRNIGRVWQRFFYTGLKSYNATLVTMLPETHESADSGSAINFNAGEGDAFQTIIQWLHGRTGSFRAMA